MVILSLLSCLFFISSNSTAKSRGTFIFICAIVSILFFDHDHNENPPEPATATQKADFFISRWLNETLHVFGLSDHKAGVIFLILGLFLDTACKQILSKRVNNVVGGLKRLNALSTILATLFWLVVTVGSYLTNQYHGFLHDSHSGEQSKWHLFVVIFFISVSIGVVDFYVNSITVAKFGNPFIGSYGNVTMSLTGLLLSVLWNHPYLTGTTVLHKVVVSGVDDYTDHRLSVGVVASALMIAYGEFTI